MNSIKLANKVFEWVRSCSILPHKEVIRDVIRKQSDDAEPFVIENAERRLFERLDMLQLAFTELKHDPGNQDKLKLIGKLIVERIK